MKRSEKLFWSNYRPTEHEMKHEVDKIIKIIAQLEGPVVQWDAERQCYGLFAQKAYTPKQKVTEYGGSVSKKNLRGSYVATLDRHCCVDGFHGFKLGYQLGRWINEFDAARSFTNVILGRIIFATQNISPGEQFFCDYGDDFIRDYP